jgi:hypothetical protein
MDTPTAPALLMIGCGLLALVGSFWVDRYGGHVLAGDHSAQASI